MEVKGRDAVEETSLQSTSPKENGMPASAEAASGADSTKDEFMFEFYLREMQKLKSGKVRDLGKVQNLWIENQAPP